MTANRDSRVQGLSLRQAALLAGIGLLVVIIAAPFAQFYVFPDLVVRGEVEETLRNITENRGLFLAGIVAYLITYVADILITVGLYVLLYPVNRSLSLLVLLFRLVYIAMATAALLHYVEVFRLLHIEPSVTGLDDTFLSSHVYVLLRSYQFDWGFALIVFGCSLLVQGYLVYRARYIPAFLGPLLAIAGIGYIGHELGRYVLPDTDLGLLAITFLGELVFMVWLLVKGRNLDDV